MAAEPPPALALAPDTVADALRADETRKAERLRAGETSRAERQRVQQKQYSVDRAYSLSLDRLEARCAGPAKDRPKVCGGLELLRRGKRRGRGRANAL